MTELPSGTVALMFSDIEGSTRIVNAVGEDAYAEMLARHRSLLRVALAEHQGAEVDCRADELFAVFVSTEDAVAAALAIHGRMAALGDGGMKVRIGVNIGEPMLADDIYVGLAVNRAARICAAGHGGQLLVTAAVRDVIGDVWKVRDLGAHVLAGLPTPERIWQVSAPGGRDEFPRSGPSGRRQPVGGAVCAEAATACRASEMPPGGCEPVCRSWAPRHGCRWASWAERCSRLNGLPSVPAVSSTGSIQTGSQAGSTGNER